MPGRAVIVAVALALAAGPARAQDVGALGQDKALHLVVSAAVAGFGYTLAAQLFEPAWPRAVMGGGLALAAGIGKEVVDVLGAGSFDWLDLTFDLLGAGLGLLISVAVDVTFAHHRRRRRSLAAYAWGRALPSPRDGSQRL